jgi:oligoribonuclease NrnB/cAMP/cGMP phosphodiesterase (DHH superfamily)
MTHIIYHNDLDGFVAGTILKIVNPKSKVYSVDYDNIENIPSIKNFKRGDVVYLVDFTCPDEMMNYLNENTEFYWIDHHKSSINSSKEKGFDRINGFRKEGLSGAELTWIFCFKNKEIPNFIKLVGDFDTFRESNNKSYHYNFVIPFLYGLQSDFEKINPINFEQECFLFKKIEDFYDIDIKEIVERGKLINEYKKSFNKNELVDKCFTINFHDYKTLCLNSCSVSSFELISSGLYDENKHDIILIYYFNGNVYSYGIYSQKKDIDVSYIAKIYGGGGHPGASGFTTKEMIKELK